MPEPSEKQRPERDREAMIRKAAGWYAANRDTAPRPLVPHLKRMFGLTAAEAARALGLVARMAA